MKRGYVTLILILVGLNLCSFLNAQEVDKNKESIMAPRNAVHEPDTFPAIDPSDPELNKLEDMRSLYEKQNRTFQAPVQTSDNLLRLMQKPELTLSPEALYWVRFVRDASSKFDDRITFKDTVIVNPLYLPLLVRGEVLPADLKLYKDDFLKSSYQPASLYTIDTIFKDYVLQQKIEEEAFRYVEDNYPTAFHYSMRDLPTDVLKPKVIKKNITEEPLLEAKADANFDEVGAPVKFIPERRYWTSNFESTVQFSQNYVSPNWYKGGSSNLNLYTRNYLKYDYNKDKIKLTNEMEIKAQVYNAPKDSLHSYKMGDDVFRIHSNIGYQALAKWYYTLDAEFKTQMFTSFQENATIKQAALLSPFSINLGLGMKYDLAKTSKIDKHRKMTLSVNLAPVSYTFKYSLEKGNGFDLGRHGFELKTDGSGEYKNLLSELGSTIRMDLSMSFNRDVSWTSRLVYNTNYEKVNLEFENTLNLAISRFFSTRINVNLRYDDSVKKAEDWDSYFQLNQLLSFGFNYKW